MVSQHSVTLGFSSSPPSRSFSLSLFGRFGANEVSHFEVPHPVLGAKAQGTIGGIQWYTVLRVAALKLVFGLLRL